MLLIFIAVILLLTIIVFVFMFTDKEKAFETVTLSQFMSSNPKDDVDLIKGNITTDANEQDSNGDDIDDFNDGIIGKINNFFDDDDSFDDLDDGGDDGGDDM